MSIEPYYIPSVRVSMLQKLVVAVVAGTTLVYQSRWIWWSLTTAVSTVVVAPHSTDQKKPAARHSIGSLEAAVLNTNCRMLDRRANAAMPESCVVHGFAFRTEASPARVHTINMKDGDVSGTSNRYVQCLI